MNFTDVKSFAIPEGDVRSISIGGKTVWRFEESLDASNYVTYLEPSEYTFTALRDTTLPINGPFNTDYTWFASFNGTMYEFTENDGSYMSTDNVEIEIEDQGNHSIMYVSAELYKIIKASSMKGTIGIYYKE